MDFPERVGSLLDMPPGEKETVLRELRSHYDEIRLQLEDEGYPEQIASAKAEARLGTATEIAFTLNREHCVSSWKTAFLTALPFLAVAAREIATRYWNLAHHWTKTLEHGLVDLSLISASPAYIAMTYALAIILLGGSVREFLRDRRPLWLPVWTAAGFYLLCDGGTTRDHVDVLRFSGLAVLVLAALMGCWQVKRWRKRIIGASALVIASAIFGNYWWHPPLLALGVLAAALFFVLLFSSAIAVFRNHRYGGHLLASLFLVTWFWLSKPTFFSVGLNWFPSLQSFLAHNGVAVASVLEALALLLFARASTSDKKGQITGWFAVLCGAIYGDFVGFWFFTMLALWIPGAIHNRMRKNELDSLNSESSHGITT